MSESRPRRRTGSRRRKPATGERSRSTLAQIYQRRRTRPKRPLGMNTVNISSFGPDTQSQSVIEWKKRGAFAGNRRVAGKGAGEVSRWDLVHGNVPVRSSLLGPARVFSLASLDARTSSSPSHTHPAPSSSQHQTDARVQQHLPPSAESQPHSERSMETAANAVDPNPPASSSPSADEYGSREPSERSLSPEEQPHHHNARVSTGGSSVDSEVVPRRQSSSLLDEDMTDLHPGEDRHLVTAVEFYYGKRQQIDNKQTAETHDGEAGVAEELGSEVDARVSSLMNQLYSTSEGPAPTAGNGKDTNEPHPQSADTTTSAVDGDGVAVHAAGGAESDVSDNAEGSDIPSGMSGADSDSNNERRRRSVPDVKPAIDSNVRGMYKSKKKKKKFKRSRSGSRGSAGVEFGRRSDSRGGAGSRGGIGCTITTSDGAKDGPKGRFNYIPFTKPPGSDFFPKPQHTTSTLKLFHGETPKAEQPPAWNLSFSADSPAELSRGGSGESDGYGAVTNTTSSHTADEYFARSSCESVPDLRLRSGDTSPSAESNAPMKELSTRLQDDQKALIEATQQAQSRTSSHELLLKDVPLPSPNKLRYEHTAISELGTAGSCSVLQRSRLKSFLATRHRRQMRSLRVDRDRASEDSLDSVADKVARSAGGSLAGFTTVGDDGAVGMDNITGVYGMRASDEASQTDDTQPFSALLRSDSGSRSRAWSTSSDDVMSTAVAYQPSTASVSGHSTRVNSERTVEHPLGMGVGSVSRPVGALKMRAPDMSSDVSDTSTVDHGMRGSTPPTPGNTIFSENSAPGTPTNTVITSSRRSEASKPSSETPGLFGSAVDASILEDHVNTDSVGWTMFHSFAQEVAVSTAQSKSRAWREVRRGHRPVGNVADTSTPGADVGDASGVTENSDKHATGADAPSSTPPSDKLTFKVTTTSDAQTHVNNPAVPAKQSRSTAKSMPISSTLRSKLWARGINSRGDLIVGPKKSADTRNAVFSRLYGKPNDRRQFMLNLDVAKDVVISGRGPQKKVMVSPSPRSSKPDVESKQRKAPDMSSEDDNSTIGGRLPTPRRLPGKQAHSQLYCYPSSLYLSSSAQGKYGPLSRTLDMGVDRQDHKSSSRGSDPVSRIHGYLSERNISELLRKTNYNRRELYIIFVRFKALCALSKSVEGIDKTTFKKGVARLAVEDDRFVERVFDLVDDDGSGEVEWPEFLEALSALEKGSVQDKCRFFFRIYDLDEDGYISREDLTTMFHSSSMLGNDATSMEVVHTFVDKVFRMFGFAKNDPDAKLTLEMVIEYMDTHREHEDVWDLFGRSMLKDFSSRRRM